LLYYFISQKCMDEHQWTAATGFGDGEGKEERERK
jgi:hypothetical protein